MCKANKKLDERIRDIAFEINVRSTKRVANCVEEPQICMKTTHKILQVNGLTLAVIRFNHVKFLSIPF